MNDEGTHFKGPRAGVGEASKQAPWWRKPSQEGKTPGQTTGSHSNSFQPGFVWAALASSELFWANSLQCGSPPEVYFTLKKESRELEIIKVVKHLN